ncbi:MAG: ROK family transcriptional regulator [Clostridiales bacterium]|nr:ROK family transcriptional regulator [Clostridiales bacterium]
MNKGVERKHNLSDVIEALQRYGGMTQTQLKDRCGLLASTVSYTVRDLKKFGFIIELGQVPSDGRPGKPGSLIGLNNEKAAFLGIYAEDNFLDAQIIGIDETTLHQSRHIFEDMQVEKTIFKVIHQSLKTYPQIRGVGVAIKGIVYNDGTIRSGKRTDGKGSEGFWSFASLGSGLAEAFPQLIFAVENDANCAAVQYHHLTCREKENLVVYLLNKNPFGIGCGILVGGQLYRGYKGAAGEFFEKDSRLRDLADSLEGNSDFLTRYLPALVPHILQTAWLLDPEEVVLAGSYFDNLSQEDILAAKALFSASSVKIRIKGGILELNPARGAALLVTNGYITSFIEEVKKR